jgi:hypothetical protein
LNVNLSSWLDISQKQRRKNWDRIFFVVNVRQVDVCVSVYVIGEFLVADLGRSAVTASD